MSIFMLGLPLGNAGALLISGIRHQALRLAISVL